MEHVGRVAFYNFTLKLWYMDKYPGTWTSTLNVKVWTPKSMKLTNTGMFLM